MEFTDVDKINILQNLLNERYSASHKMRERSLKFSLWILGYVAIINGWLLLNGLILDTYQKVAISTLTTIILYFTHLFLRDIETGFINNRDVTIKVETALKLYESDTFIKSEKILPDKYKDNQKSGSKGHFATIYLWIKLGWLITILVIWFGNLSAQESISKKTVRHSELDCLTINNSK